MNPEATFSAIATNSSTIVGSLVKQPIVDSVSIAELWIGRLDMFSSIFGFFCTVILGVLALLTWGNIRQKSEAERQVNDIKKINSRMYRMQKDFNQIISDSKATFKAMSDKMKNAETLLNEANGVLNETKTKGAEFSNLKKKMEKLSNEIAGTITQANNIGTSLPYIVNSGETIGFMNEPSFNSVNLGYLDSSGRIVSNDGYVDLSNLNLKDLGTINQAMNSIDFSKVVRDDKKSKK